MCVSDAEAAPGAGRMRRPGPALRARLTETAVMLAARWTPYLEAELLGLAHLVGPGSVCVDVGAAAGLYTIALSRLVGPAGWVHSVEPLPFAHPRWTRVLRARERRNVQHHGVALAAEPGSGMMSVPLGRRGPVTGRAFLARRSCGVGSNAEFNGHIAVRVPVDTLDDLCARTGVTRLDFVKIDVEGAELQVLDGGRHAIDSFRPTLLIEIEARHLARYRCSPADVVGWLTERGYTMHTWRRGWQTANTVCQQVRNYLFRPSDRPLGPTTGSLDPVTH